MTLSADQVRGCLIGLATGDALGAQHEGGLLERLVWVVIGRTFDGRLRWTDDTQMAIDLAEAILEEHCVCPDAIAKRFALSYRWTRGYGSGAARVLKRIRRGETWESASKAVYAEGSYGNGAAMRAAVLGLFFPANRNELIEAARVSALVTHAHPLGVEGAVLIALAAHTLSNMQPVLTTIEVVRASCSRPEFLERLKLIGSWLETNQTIPPREVAAQLGNGITAPTSCPTALYIALKHLDMPFETMMGFIIECGGDVDTIGAMAGALWGVANGAARLPSVAIESREYLDNLASRIYRRILLSADEQNDAIMPNGNAAMKCRRKGFVSLWIGKFRSLESVEEYFGIPDEIGVCLPPVGLINDLGVDELPGELLEVNFEQMSPRPLGDLLRDATFSAGFIDQAVKTARQQGIESAQGVALLYDFDYQAHPGWQNTVGPLQFIGSFPFVGPAAIDERPPKSDPRIVIREIMDDVL